MALLSNVKVLGTTRFRRSAQRAILPTTSPLLHPVSMSLLQELKRRKVFRTTLAYLGAAFVTAQAAQLLVDGLDLPEWIFRAILVALVIGFPLVVGLAWAFDVTPKGIERTGDGATPSTARVPWRRVALPVTAAVLMLIAAFAFVSLKESESAPINADLVAVLPFHVSADPQIAYLREGMVDLLAAKLTGEGGPRAADPRGVMSVVRRETTETPDITDETASDIARTVGAGQVLVGSVVGSAKRFTVQAKLLRVPGGKIIAQAEQDGTADSLMLAVDRLVAKLLSLQAGEGPQRLDQLMTPSLPALRQYLDGRVAYRSGHFGRARQLFAEAVDKDSTFALAAIGHLMTVGWGEGPETDRRKSRRTLANYRDKLGKVDRAIAYAMVGDDLDKQRTWKKRLDDWDAAVTLAPDNIDALFWYADYLFHYGTVADRENAVDLADQSFSRVLQMDSAYLPALLHRIDAAMRMDRVDKIREFEPLRMKLDPNGTAASYQRSKRIRYLGDSAAIAAQRAALDTMSVASLAAATRGAGFTTGSVDDGLRATELRLKKATTKSDRTAAVWDAFDHYFLWGMPGRGHDVLDLLRAQGDADDAALVEVMSALYWDGDQQQGAAAADELARMKFDEPEMKTWQACTVEQWRAWHGDTRSFEANTRLLAQVPADSTFNAISANVCEHTLYTIRSLVQKQSDLAARVQALNTIMREGPNTAPMMVNAANIVLGW